MLKIWGRPTSSNVAKVMWAVAELDVPNERVDAGGSFGIVDTPAYRALNPNGQIPTIEDDGFVLWESNAIVRYLAAKHGSGTLWPEDVRVRGDADRWMDWTATTLAPAIDRLRAAYRAPEERRDAAAIAQAVSAAAGVLGMLDAALVHRSFLAGEALSIGDIAIGSMVHRWFLAPLEKPALRGVADWYERMQQRPPFAMHILKIVR